MIHKVLSKEIIRYGISGVLISLVNLGVYTGLLILGLRFEIANILALILSRVAGFALNKYFVFRSSQSGSFWREFWGFMAARGLSGLVDYFGVILLVGQLHLDEVVSKGAVMVFVIVLNYFLGKFLVFRPKESASDFPANSENERKYRSKNPIRRLLVRRLMDRVVSEALRGQQVSTNPDTEEPRTDLLDAGCGEGFVVHAIHERAPEKTIVGLDVSIDALEIARRNNPSVRFLEGSVSSLPFADTSVPIVLLIEVLEHLEEPASALREAQRVAADTILVSVPMEPWFRLGNLLTFRHVSRLGNPIEHIHHWTPRQFQAFIQENVRGTVRFYRSFPWSIAVIDQSNEGEQIRP